MSNAIKKWINKLPNKTNIHSDFTTLHLHILYIISTNAMIFCPPRSNYKLL